MSKIVLILFLIIYIQSCEKVTVVDLHDSEPRIFVEGYINNGPGPYKINLKYTNNFQNDNNYPTINNCFMTISDDKGQLDTLLEITPGVYQTQKLQGIADRTYSLKFSHNNKLYEAKSYMQPEVRFDTIVYEFKETNTFYTTPGYYVTTIGREPVGYGNYYRVLAFKGDSLFDGVADYFVSDDLLVDGNIIVNSLPFQFEKGDTAYVELWHLDQPGYQYYNTLIGQLFSGGPFSPPANNVQGNISNGALGYFGAYSFDRKQVIIE